MAEARGRLGVVVAFVLSYVRGKMSQRVFCVESLILWGVSVRWLSVSRGTMHPRKI